MEDVSIEWSDFSKAIGDKVRVMRVEAGLSKSELARRAELSQPKLKAMEDGKNFSIKILFQVARGLDTSPLDLMKCPALEERLMDNCSIIARFCR